LAAELSQLPGAADDMGDLGFITKEIGESAFNEFVFDSGAAPGSLSHPSPTRTSRHRAATGW